MTKFEGALTALVTPFKSGEIDEPALRDLVDRQIAGGIDGLVPCGTTGESVTLTTEEHARVVRIVVEQAAGRVPVVAGAGTVSTRHTIELAQIAREARADGLLLVAPYYNRPTQAGLVAHFRAVLHEVPMPAILYNIPSRTGVDITADTIERLAEVREIVGVKEASGNVLRAQEIVARTGDRFSVLSGDDALVLGILAVGGRGVISVTSNLAPAEVKAVIRKWRAGAHDEARALHLRLLPLHEALFCESNPGPVKAALAMASRVAAEIRLPLVWPTSDSQDRIRAALTKSGITP